MRICSCLYCTAANNANDVPRTKFFLRGKGGIESMWGPPSSSKDEVKIERDENFDAPGAADLMEFTEDGKLVVLVRTASGFTVRDADTGAVVVEAENPGIHAVAWSPLGSQLLTWQRPRRTRTSATSSCGTLPLARRWNASTTSPTRATYVIYAEWLTE